MKFSKRLNLLIISLISLFIVFFVGREFNPATGDRSFVITTNGISHFRKGLDVSGGTKLVYKISYDKYEALYQGSDLTSLKKLIENIILKNIDGRISKLGVSDYKAYVQNLNNQPYIVVEIGGIADLDQAKKIIGKTVELEFKLQNPAAVTAKTIQTRKEIAQKIFAEISKSPELMSKLTNGKGSENVFYNNFSGASLDQLPDLYKNNKDLQNMKPGDVKTMIEGKYATITNSTSTGSTVLNGWTMVRFLGSSEAKDLSGNMVKVYSFEDVFVQDREIWISATDDSNNVLNGAYFKYANVSSSQVGEPVVAINLDDKGKEVFCNITEKNIGKPMAIFIGGELLTAPTIQAKICGGTAEINGGFTAESAKELSDSLNDGALPAPLVLMQEDKISPSLGDDALTGALWATLCGFIVISILILVMYGFKRMVLTSIVLLAFLSVLFAVLKMFDYAMSLAGIAAIILSIGMGVDANILIYERMNEEMKKGKSVDTAIDEAKARSWSAIKDGQISSGLIALLLFTMGINIFKGFGAMIIITLILTLVFNVSLTKELLHMFYDKKSK